MKEVVAFTDGACRGNPGPGAYAVRLDYQGRQKIFSEGFEKTTNNRMEILALLKGLEVLKEPCNVKVFTDSQYVADAINKGSLDRWASWDWRRKPKSTKLIKNPDLWKALYELLKKHRVTVEWVKGHAGIEGNEAVDQAANDAIDAGNLQVDTGYMEADDRYEENKDSQMTLDF